MNTLNKSFAELNFPQEIHWTYIFISSGVELGAVKFVIYQILYCIGMEKYLH